MRVDYKPSRRYAEYVRRICNEWEPAGVSGNDLALIRHIPTGTVLAYGLHDGGNDHNSARNFASDVQRVCGCRLIEVRGRKRSRKAVRPSGFRLDDKRSNVAAQDRIADLSARHNELRRIWNDLVSDPCRTNALLAREVLAEIVVVEAELSAAYQPYERIAQ